MRRVDVARVLGEETTTEDLFVSSIGGILDDWWNHRPGGEDNTMSVSILGSVSSTALGLAIALPHRRVVAIETDGSMLMNLGVLCTLGAERPPNLTVVVLDNGLYECIGSAPTLTSRNADLEQIATGAGCLNCVTVHDEEILREVLRSQLDDDELGFVVAKIEPGMQVWPAEKKRYTDGVEDKYRFIRHVERLEGIVVHASSPHV
ncbi:thiamine pyrophosphate-dependent enzyme [Nocardioides soli]|uniref:Thiamine pyrophosphate-dependent acetolactate synthase large subunit-like protein n=1 Tax=Nocardioides soli TaxID=1036020 RepID=A0A7W4W0S6_9ACTN|nr:thiamine pyrophosphate-dependent enzyme [Nocardioides soli]MBB3045368.1 thiamine pyrophosphate-dependent acetolactate synthase large subunit-like protein [Nocardioides soli]